MAGRYKKFKTAGSFGSCQPAVAKPVFGGFSQPAQAKPPNGESKHGAGGLCSKKVPSGATGSNGFNFGVPSNEVKITNKNIRTARRFASIIYKCNACGLCFDRQEVMFKHLNLNNCFPLKKITRIHCICGLELDKYNYDYHSEVHRKFPMLKKKDITINDDENIDVGGMMEKFMYDLKQGTVSTAEVKYKINASAVDDKHTTSIFAKKINKSCVVYRCKCRLCFERPEFLFNHLNICDPDEKITRILCMCGLEFDKHNYDYHCEVHCKFTTLHVKKITSNGDEIINISGMWQEFAKDDEIKSDKSTKEAQVQTVDLKESFVKSPATEDGFKGNGTFEQLLGNKLVRAVIDTLESGIDGKENQTKITIIIAKASEKTVECPDKSNTGDKNNEVAEIRQSKATASQKAADNTTNGITAPTKGEHDSTDNHEASDIASNENTAPTKPENKAINSSDPADGEANEITEQIEQLNINDHQENSDLTTNETSALTITIIENTAINNLESNDNIKQIDRPNKINHSQENLNILTNETSAPTLPIPENKAINNPEPKDSGEIVIIEPIEQPNQMNVNEENSDISTNETSAPTPTVPENKAMDNPDPEPKDSGTIVIIEPMEQPNQMNVDEENSYISTNETSAPTPTVPENKAIDNLETKGSGKIVFIEPINRPNKVNDDQENSLISKNETSAPTPTVLESKAMDNPEPKDSGTIVIIEPIEQPNHMNVDEENSDISTNETPAPTKPENKDTIVVNRYKI